MLTRGEAVSADFDMMVVASSGRKGMPVTPAAASSYSLAIGRRTEAARLVCAWQYLHDQEWGRLCEEHVCAPGPAEIGE